MKGDTLKELVKATQDTTMKSWFEKVEDPECLKYMAWVACDHMEGKKANYASLHRILTQHFNINVSSATVKTWMKKVESGELKYERPTEEAG